MEIKFEIIDLLLVSPAIALFLASLIPLTIKILRGNQEQNSVATMIYSLIGIVAAVGLVYATQDVKKTAFMNALVFDGVSSLSALIVLGITAFSLFFARENLATVGRQFSEFVFLLLNAAIGMLIIAWSNDLMMLFIGIEYLSLALYILIALSNEARLSKEAAFKYFILGSFASAVLLYGIAFIYGATGTTYLNEVTQMIPDVLGKSKLLLVGFFMLTAGLCFKVAIFPFHAWAPDVYQGAPTPVTAFMATGVKAVLFAAFLRVVATEALLADRMQSFVSVLEWLAVFTMVAGNIAAIVQNNLKRLLAYSGIAHSGYALIGVIASGISGENTLGASSVMFYILGYSLMTLGAFGVVCLFEKKEDSIVDVDDLRGMGRRHPWIAFCFSIFMLSLAGIPPTVGFFGKFFIFSAAVNQGLFWLAFWGVISSVISVYYYLRPLVVMYMRDEEGAEVQPSQQLSGLAVSLAAILVLVTGLAANPFYKHVIQSVASLF